MMIMIMIIIAVTQSIFKLGPPDFAWKQIYMMMMMIMMMLMMMIWKDDADGALDPWSCFVLISGF